MSIHEILQQYWGYATFRPMQEDIIRSVMSGRDTLALLPTGGGKSVCFQVPGLATEGLCLVISPLIALMKDQVEQLTRRGILAQAIYSGMSNREIDIALDNCIYGQTKFLYISPERLQTELFQVRAAKMKIGLLAIDEAHCISQWGYDFRPPYLQIAEFRQLIPQVPCIALTATATEVVKKDIQEKLAFKNGAVFQKSFARANLSYSAFFEENKEKRLLEMLRNVPGTAVVYVRNRKRTQQAAEYLRKMGISADYYHAGLPNEVRSKKQEAWIQNKTRVIVATNAFGMGIDKPDVRLVVHIDLPDSLEAYYQEAGRAGRDEKLAYATALFNQQDINQLRQNIQTSYPTEDLIRRVYQALANYFKLAAGSGFMAAYPFDIEDFCHSFDLPQFATYHALKKLEEQGFIEFNESYYSPSRMSILVNNEELYKLQVSNIKFDSLIKVILRSYGGELFTNFLTIQESKIGERLGISAPEVVLSLRHLQERGIISYEPQQDQPQIVFTSERYSAEKLPLNLALLRDRKMNYQQKVEAVIRYIQSDSRCRTQQLLEYFGELSDESCQVCDYCLKQKKLLKGVITVEKLQKDILKKLAQAPQFPKELATQLKPASRDMSLEAIRQLLDSGKIGYGSDGKLMINP